MLRAGDTRGIDGSEMLHEVRVGEYAITHHREANLKPKLLGGFVAPPERAGQHRKHDP